MPADGNVFLRKRQLLARGNSNLQLHQVERSNHLGDGMLHLQARIHLKKIKLPILIHQKFHGAGICVSPRASEFHCGLAHCPPQILRS